MKETEENKEEKLIEGMKGNNREGRGIKQHKRRKGKKDGDEEIE